MQMPIWLAALLIVIALAVGAVAGYLYRKKLAEKEIGCAVYYPLSLHLQTCFKELGGKAGDFPVCEEATAEVLALPIYPESTAAQREYVRDSIAEFFSK